MKTLTIFILSLFIFVIACDDDERSFSITPSLGFETTSTTLLETNAAGTRVGVTTNVTISEPVTISISVTELGSVEYGVDYTTEPAPVNGVITLNIDSETESPGFFVYPKTSLKNPRKVIFEITTIEGSGLNRAQASALAHTVSIDKKQLDPNQLTIAQVRALFTGTATVITQDKFIEGIVISSNDNVTSRNIYLQDETAGIALRFYQSNVTDPGKVVLGDNIRISLKDVSLSQFSGLLQLGGDGATNLPHTKVTKLGTAPLPTPKTITLAQLNTQEYQSQRVRVINVTITTADGTKTLSGNNAITDASGASTLRVESYAPFSSTVAPQGLVTITGIASVFTTSQLVPMSDTDIVKQ